MYILKCADATLYTGSTNDVERRVVAHNESKTGAKYTKSRRPVELVYTEKCRTRGAALKREWAIKKLTRTEKLAIIHPYGRH
ncbi:MAG: GIY-YIG nuclease family protein [bacterium]